MATLSDVRNRIKRDLVLTNSSEYDTQIDDAIRSALRWVYGRPFWFLESTQNITLLEGDESVALPDNFGSFKMARISVNSTWRTEARGFDYHDYEDLLKDYKATTLTAQAPNHYAIQNGTLYVEREADADYTIEVTYWKKDASLPSGDSGTSVWFGDEGIDVIRTRAFAMFKDEAREYEATEKDWARADRYYNELVARNNLYHGA